MDLSDIITLLINFTQQWIGTTIPRILSAFIGTLLCVLAGAALWERRLKAIGAALIFLTGAVLIVFAMDPSLPYVFVKASYLTRIRVLMFFFSFVVVVITIEAIRRSHLQERYALLWVVTGLIILMVAFFPNILDFFILTIGTSYLTSVVGIIFAFLLLIAFHFSMALSGYQKKQTRIAQRCAILDERIEALERLLADQLQEAHPDRQVSQIGRVPMVTKDSANLIDASPRSIRGSQVAAPLIIVVAVIAVLSVGLLTPQPMVGDEVTHYYMLKKQAEDLSQPNFLAKIPTGWGALETRSYPHAFLWHYFGALVLRLSGGSFSAVQFYQTFFWAQFLYVAYLLAKSRGGIQSRSMIPYLLVLASLPLSLIFSVTFYQDIPVSAQVLTAFYLLNERRSVLATVFICLAIGFKLTALLFLPAFFGMMIYRGVKRQPARRAALTLLFALLTVSLFTWGVGKAVKTYGHAGFYPEQKIRQLFGAFGRNQRQVKADKATSAPSAKARPSPAILETEANRPGNLKLPENYLIYGGVVLYLVFFLWMVASFFLLRKNGQKDSVPPSAWLWITGVSYIVMVAYFLRAAPDARFFLPGIPFILLPMTEKLVRLPKAKLLIALIAALSILQGGYALAKTYQLRQVTPDIQAAIAFLKQHPPSPPKVFMYPEGNYRLFPAAHEWYFNFHLKDFWRGDNDARIRMLRKYKIGAIVIKRYLIAEVGSKIVNLGVYPTYFAREINRDRRFKKLFENNAVVIFQVPYPLVDTIPKQGLPN